MFWWNGQIFLLLFSFLFVLCVFSRVVITVLYINIREFGWRSWSRIFYIFYELFKDWTRLYQGGGVLYLHACLVVIKNALLTSGDKSVALSWIIGDNCLVSLDIRFGRVFLNDKLLCVVWYLVVNNDNKKVRFCLLK